MNGLRFLTAALLLTASLLTAGAEGLAIHLHSNYYDTYGADHSFLLGLGSNVSGKIGVDCGMGIIQYDIVPAYYDEESRTMVSTNIKCTATPQGNVSIFTYDDVEIDYVNFDGCGITEIDFYHPENLKVLSMRHNALLRLDLTDFSNLQSVDLGGNPFSEAPLVIGPDKPELAILDLDFIDNMDPSFSLSDYPALVSFAALYNTDLRSCNTSGCPNLIRLSVGSPYITEIDLSNNPELQVLNVSGTSISDLDVTTNTKLRELYCMGLGLTQIDVTHCPELYYFFCGDNQLTEIDLSNNPDLNDFSCRNNLLTHIDLSANENLANVNVMLNDMDFRTLPAPNPLWLSYDFNQRPMPVPTSYLVGSPLDLSDRVMREGTETSAVVYVHNPEGPVYLQELDPADYSFDEGVLTINVIPKEKVYVAFTNSLFGYCELYTTEFRVKDASTFGQNTLAVTLNPADMNPEDLFSCTIGIEGASPDTPKKFYVDLGDGALIEAETSTSELAEIPTFSHAKGNGNGTVKIYVEEDDEVTAFGFGGRELQSIDISTLESLRHLSLTGTGLTNIDMLRLYRLQSLTLTGNRFDGYFSLEGLNGAYTKKDLKHIDLSDNGIEDIYLSDPESILTLDLSHNRLEGVNLTDGALITDLDLSHNRIEFLSLGYQSSLKRVNVSHNAISQIVLPETNVLESADLSYNSFTFSTIPSLSSIGANEYTYYPQAELRIPHKGMGYDLANQFVEIDGARTSFAWFDSEGNRMVKGVEYSETDGVTRFLTSSEGKLLHCCMTNTALPELTLQTSPMLSAGMPQYVLGEFTTTRDNQTASLSLAAENDDSAVWIDWTGDGTFLSAYCLQSTYTLHSAKTFGGARVKVYSYEPQNDLSVFSVSGVAMKDVDLSGMDRLKTLTLIGAGISEIALPVSTRLEELGLINNNFSEFDFSLCPNVKSLSFENNKFERVDLSELTQLEGINFASNKLQEVVLGEHPALWAVHLNSNKLTSLDLSGVPAAYQVLLSNNNLTEIDLENKPDLHVVFLDNNAFTFQTLPLPRPEWTYYLYADQARLPVQPQDGVVDLSAQYMVGDEVSTFTWLEGEPWYDAEENAMMGVTLEEGVDYTIENGVTRFLRDIDGVMCAITNPMFPGTYLATELFDARLSAIPNIGDAELGADPSGSRTDSMLYDLLGRPVTNRGPGVYIQNGRKIRL